MGTIWSFRRPWGSEQREGLPAASLAHPASAMSPSQDTQVLLPSPFTLSTAILVF